MPRTNLHKFKCPRCGKWICKTDNDSCIEMPCPRCKELLLYDKGAITVITDMSNLKTNDITRENIKEGIKKYQKQIDGELVYKTE
ncbi:MAG: hypothetical protein WC834_08425 [Eubacteriales bacterium]